MKEMVVAVVVVVVAVAVVAVVAVVVVAVLAVVVCFRKLLAKMLRVEVLSLHRQGRYGAALCRLTTH